MAANNDNVDNGPSLRDEGHHHADKYGTKFVNKTQKASEKVEKAKGGDSEKPAGGFDATPIPKAPAGYTLKITFHRASNLPFADMPSFSSDPYIMAVMLSNLPKRHKQDPELKLRTPTIHRNVNPEWNTVWTIAHVPASGFHLKCRLYDEDPSDHDDRLGNVHVDVNGINESWEGFKERSFEIKKRMGSKRAYTIRGCAALLSRQIKLDGHVVISIENLGRSEGDGGRMYTISPLPWSQHYSPLIGLIAGTKDKAKTKDGKRATERYNFQAIQMQFQGPVPEALYHRYVEFKPFVAGMFTSHTLRGRILNHALHHQHARIYNYDGSTKYGEFEKPGIDTTKQFLDFVRYDQGGRIFTYVITLDGQLRFTETGKEFGIDLLSKHTMHSDVSIYIAFSGEFFIRRLKHAHKEKEASPDPGNATLPPAPDNEAQKAEDENNKDKGKEKHKEHGVANREHHDSLMPPPDHHTARHDSTPAEATGSQRRSWSPWRQRSATSSTHSPAPHASQTHMGEEPSEDPSHYELIIDNDSGTYRPNAKYLGQLKKFLQHNLPGLRIAVLDCQKDEEKMTKLKSEQRERKKKSGQQMTYMQNVSSSSLSSSDEEELERRAAAEDNEAEKQIGETGKVKAQWNKVKQMAKGDNPESNSNEDEKHGISSSSNHNAALKKTSTSTGEKKSFDTATEHGDGHFVTPKPSLGDGGLNAFEEEDRPLSRDIDKELEKRGFDGFNHDSQQKTSEQPMNGHLSNSTGFGSVHQIVTGTA